MKQINVFSIIIILISAFSCSRFSDNVIPLSKNQWLKFTAAWADELESDARTSLQEDGKSIWWSPGEEINIFCGSGFAGHFISTNTEASSSATFKGCLTVLTGKIEQVNASADYWAIYPYNEKNSCDGNSVTLTLSAMQSGIPGTFEEKFFPAVARSSTLDLQFYNVCGGACFSVTRPGVIKVIFKSNNGVPMAGKVKLGFGEDRRPQILEISEPSDSVIIRAPNGGFVPGVKYFAAMLPNTHSEGITVSLRTVGKIAKKQLKNTITVRRAAFGLLENIDEGIAYVYGGNNPDGIIDFADSGVKSSCVNAFDTNGDGELSYAEAADVIDISTAFSSKLYTSFDEFCYFTDVKEIPSEWFKDRIRLKSISFPLSLKSIGRDAFSGCTALVNVGISDVTAWLNIQYENVGAAPFNAATEGHLYLDDEELTELTIPQNVESFNAWAFYNCSGLEKMALEPINPPVIGLDALTGTTCNFFVKKEYVSAYKTAWPTLVSRIFRIEQIPGSVDLGLSVLWATCNLGASTPEEYGDYYAWGELETKTDYSWAEYKWCDGSKTTLTKYNTLSSYGVVDNITELLLSDDVVSLNLGGGWRFPSLDEAKELINDCSWQRTTENGIAVFRVTSKKAGYTDASIILPIAGYYSDSQMTHRGNYGLYWTSSLVPNNPYAAWRFDFGGSVYFDKTDRSLGLTIRPVHD